MSARLAALLLAALPAIACQTAPPPAQEVIASADIGEAPDVEQGKLAAQFAVKSVLYDPSSSQFQWDERGWVRGYFRPTMSATTVAWALPFSVNAKNRMGGYIGFKSYVLYAIKGDVVAMGVPVEGYGGVDREDIAWPKMRRTVAQTAEEHERTFGQVADSK